MKNKTTLLFGLLIVGLVALLFVVRGAREPQEIVNNQWPGTNVTCLLFGHQNISSHIHPMLVITVDGVQEPIPANIGVTEGCMAEVHTHDGTGQIHVESMIQGKTFKLTDFFAVREESIDREGYAREVVVNGSPVDTESYEFRDGDQIEVRYNSGEGVVVSEQHMTPQGHDGSMQDVPAPAPAPAPTSPPLDFRISL